MNVQEPISYYKLDDWTMRVISDANGNPWFPASDACRALGMNSHKTGTGPFVEHIAEKHKRTIGTILPLTPLNALPPHTTMLSEAGLYQLIWKSRKPEAVRFQEWVTEEVLPSIRKTGSYVYKKDEPPLMLQARALSEEAVEDAVQKAMKPLQLQIQQLKDNLMSSVNTAMSSFAPRRREVPTSVRDTHRKFAESRQLRCACCDDVKTSWLDFNVDHYKDRQDPSLTATWAICAKCNQCLKDAQMHKEAEPSFLAYQKWLRAWRVKIGDIKTIEDQGDLFE